MLQDMPIDRRALLKYAATLPIISTVPRLARAADDASEAKADYTLRIAPVSLELAPGKTIKTTGYNGKVPGPVLWLREGRPVPINVINDAGYPDIIHWHGLYLPAFQDGATEEGSPIIPVGQSHIYSFTPKPSGTRWYHSHAMAMMDLTRSTYSGEFGFLIVEPASGETGRYDRESAARRSSLGRLLGQHARHAQRAAAGQWTGSHVRLRDTWGADAWARRTNSRA